MEEWNAEKKVVGLAKAFLEADSEKLKLKEIADKVSKRKPFYSLLRKLLILSLKHTINGRSSSHVQFLSLQVYVMGGRMLLKKSSI